MFGQQVPEDPTKKSDKGGVPTTQTAANTLSMNALSVVLLLLVAAQAASCEEDVVTVGIIHSLTGAMAISERDVVDAELLAIDQLNERGGVMVQGKQMRVDYELLDGKSDPDVFATEAAKLVNTTSKFIFGGWTSSSRKAMLPVVEEANALLIYSIQYEGEECSRSVIYGGATPNQQSEPATRFLYERGPARGKPFFLIGSDYVFPRTSNAITSAQLFDLGGEVAGELYIPLSSSPLLHEQQAATVVRRIRSALPDGGNIINTINGDANAAFFKELRESGVTPQRGYYVMSYSIAETEINAIGPYLVEGSYASWPYFESLSSPASQRFEQDFKVMYGAHRRLSDPMEAAYNMLMLWAKAVEKANSLDVDAVREAFIGECVPRRPCAPSIHPPGIPSGLWPDAIAPRCARVLPCAANRQRCIV